MRNLLIGIAAASLASLPAPAQNRGGRQSPHAAGGQGDEGPRSNAPVGHGYIPSRGPLASPNQGRSHTSAPIARDNGQGQRGNGQGQRDNGQGQRDNGPGQRDNGQGQVQGQRGGNQLPNYRDQPDHPARPHVHPQRDQWIGHESGRGDDRYRTEQPWVHGHFAGGFGPRYVYRLRGGAPERFSVDGNFFMVAQADWDLCSDWDWNNDNIVIYADPDHDGWYLAYNTRLGTYSHVEYLGP